MAPLRCPKTVYEVFTLLALLALPVFGADDFRSRDLVILDAQGKPGKGAGAWPSFILVSENARERALCNGFFVRRTKRALFGATASHCLKRASERGLTRSFVAAFDKSGGEQILNVARIEFQGQLSDAVPMDPTQPVWDFAVIEIESPDPQPLDQVDPLDQFDIVDKVQPIPKMAVDVKVAGYRFSPAPQGNPDRIQFDERKCRLNPTNPYLWTGPKTKTQVSFSGRGLEHDAKFGMFLDSCSLNKGRSGSLITNADGKPLALLHQAMTTSILLDNLVAEGKIKDESATVLIELSDGSHRRIQWNQESFFYGVGFPLVEGTSILSRILGAK